MDIGMLRRKSAALALLRDLADDLDQFADVSDGQPNRDMQVLVRVRAAIEALEGR